MFLTLSTHFVSWPERLRSSEAMDFAASLSADLSAALAVDVVEDRPRTGERHVCVRPVSAETVESVNIDEVQGHSPSWLTCCACLGLQITGTVVSSLVRQLVSSSVSQSVS